MVQQGGAAPTGYIQRASTGTEVLRGLRDVAFFIPSLLGFELSYSDDELLEYLQGISDKDQPDGGYYSDDKARQVTQRWADGNKKFYLDAKKIKLLIREMQGGIVTNGDRQAIMTLLEQSSDETVSDVLSPANIDFAQLLGDLSPAPTPAELFAGSRRIAPCRGISLLDSFARWFAAGEFCGSAALAERLLRRHLRGHVGTRFRNEWTDSRMRS